MRTTSTRNRPARPTTTSARRRREQATTQLVGAWICLVLAVFVLWPAGLLGAYFAGKARINGAGAAAQTAKALNIIVAAGTFLMALDQLLFAA